MVTQIRDSTEKDLAKRITEFDHEVTKAIQTDMKGSLYDQAARQAISDGERLEMIALKSLSTGSQEDLFKEFGFDGKKVTFEAERFLGKQIIKNRNDESAQQSRLDKPPMVTENPYADDFNDMSTEGAFDFFSKLGNED